MSTFTLLWFNLNIEWQVHWLLKWVSRLFVNRVYRLNINLSDVQVVGLNHKWQPIAILILFEDSAVDDVCWIFVEVIEIDLLHSSSDPWWKSLASIAHKVFDHKHLVGAISTLFVNFEHPPVRHLESESSMISCLNKHHISHEVRSQK